MSSGTAAMSERYCSGAVEAGAGDLLDEYVSLAIDHAVALLDRGASDRLGEMVPRRSWQMD